jgi:hypothetical protein
MKEVLSFFAFGIGALCFVAFFTALKPLAVTAATGLANPAYCSTEVSPALACQRRWAPSPLVGEGWGEGSRSIVRAKPLTRIAS